MVSPVAIFWKGITKRRWKIIYHDENYNKIIDSNYNNLKMVYGATGDYRLMDFCTNKETLIADEEITKYEVSIVWYPIHLENRIIEKIKGNNSEKILNKK
jgi:hypothetical protein